jgi:hypothetical protein
MDPDRATAPPRVTVSTLAQALTMSPPSPMTIVFSSTNRCTSAAKRKWLTGTSSSRSHAACFSLRARSHSATWASHGSKRTPCSPSANASSTRRASATTATSANRLWFSSAASFSIWMSLLSGFQSSRPYFSRKSSGVPMSSTTSAARSALLRAALKQWGWAIESAPRPAPLVNTGMAVASVSSRSASPASSQ